MAENIYWVGIRQSEIGMISNTFVGSICLFGEDEPYSYIYSKKRINQNIKNEDVQIFYKEKLEDIIIKDPKCKFMFYNQNKAFDYGEHIITRTICCNEKQLLDNLSNKIWVRKIFTPIVNTIPSLECEFQEIDFKQLSVLFPNAKEFIVQKPKSGGGTGTFLFNKNNLKKNKINFTKKERILISPYIENSYSINITLLIGAQNYLIFPGSIQIVEKIRNQFLYRGADYVAYNQLAEELKNNIFNNATIISKRLQALGYKGVIGIDFLVKNQNEVFFIELNNRFQASSDLLNISLKEYNTSLQDLNILAFENKYLPEYKIKLLASSYFYYNENPNSFLDIQFKLKTILKAQNNHAINDLILIRDGYAIDCECTPLCYGFKINSTKQICSVSPDGKLWVNENIRYTNTTLIDTYRTDLLALKVALLNQGVCVDPSIASDLKKAVYRSIDLNFNFNNKKISLNCPYKINFSEISPFYINEKYFLSFANVPLFKINVDKCQISHDLKTSTNKSVNQIIYMSEDRLRIKTMSGCDYKKSNVGCDFCNNSNVCTYFEAIDIFESIQHANEIYQHKIRHFLIGGGTDFRNNYWDIVEQVVNFIHSNSKLPNEITLMAVPFEKKQLKKIKQWGISDLSINIEIYDDNLAKKIMRGKRIDRNKYFELFKEAKTLWPQYGDVRSMVIVGLDTTQNLIKLITELIEIGVQPVLSIFRPLPNTPLEYNTMPSNEYLENIYYICNRICKEKNSEYSLGPKCVACKNNILAL